MKDKSVIGFAMSVADLEQNRAIVGVDIVLD